MTCLGRGLRALTRAVYVSGQRFVREYLCQIIRYCERDHADFRLAPKRYSLGPRTRDISQLGAAKPSRRSRFRAEDRATGSCGTCDRRAGTQTPPTVPASGPAPSTTRRHRHRDGAYSARRLSHRFLIRDASKCTCRHLADRTSLLTGLPCCTSRSSTRSATHRPTIAPPRRNRQTGCPVRMVNPVPKWSLSPGARHRREAACRRLFLTRQGSVGQITSAPIKIEALFRSAASVGAAGSLSSPAMI